MNGNIRNLVLLLMLQRLRTWPDKRCYRGYYRQDQKHGEGCLARKDPKNPCSLVDVLTHLYSFFLTFCAFTHYNM